jgi:hypothetical protein
MNSQIKKPNPAAIRQDWAFSATNKKGSAPPDQGMIP